MPSTDARELSEESLQLLRRQAHRLRHHMEMPWIKIAEIVGVSLTTMMAWVRRYHLSSPTLGEVSSLKRGRRYGEKRTLEPAQEEDLHQTVLHETPAALGLGHALWSRAAVQQAIEVKFGLKMPISTVGEYLRRWGCTPQRPVQRAQEQDDQALQRWLDEVYPKLHQRAQAEGAEIHWVDETAVRQDTAWVRGFAPAGHTPELRHRVNWSHLTVISALSNQGHVHFALHEGSINAERFIEFLQQLMGEASGRTIFLIVDNLRVHHAKKVQDWLAKPDHHARPHRVVLSATVLARAQPGRVDQPRSENPSAPGRPAQV
ncbi:MAG: IS630 family transposase [Leptothrix sp. (in: b-proteobacteria)]